MRSGKKAGGQKGNPATTLRLQKDPNERVRHQVDSCEHCGRSLASKRPDPIIERQVLDLPLVKLLCTAHEVESKTCHHCGFITTAPWPDVFAQEESAAIYGPNLRAFGVYLTTTQMISFQRTKILIEDLFGQNISTSSLVSWNQKASERLFDTDQKIATELAKSLGSVHFDETGMRCEGKNQWLHSASTSHLTHFQIHPKRGAVAMHAMGILPLFQGTAIHDRWEAYFGFENCRHGLCGSHLIRDLRFIWESEEEPWAKKMRSLLKTMNQAVNRAKKRGKTRFNAPTLIAWHQRYLNIIEAGYKHHDQRNQVEGKIEQRGLRGRKKQRVGKNLLDALNLHQDSVLLFLYDFSVPFTNNQAEQDLRMNKVKMKVSGCFRSIQGAKNFCRIRGYLATARKQSWNLLEALISVFNGYPLQPNLV